MTAPGDPPPVVPVVYVETNFLLELAYQQEESTACERLAQAAADGRIQLCIPAFSIVEARVAWRRQTKQRAELLTTLRRELRELTRSRPHVELTDKSADLVAALVNSGEEDRQRLEAAIGAVERVGTVLPLDAAGVRNAYAAEHQLNLSAQDATVYASVRQHLAAAGGGPKCFLNRNARDFAVPEVVEELERCKVLPSFASGEGYVTSLLRSGSPG